jgi:hypothetical protein
MILRVLKLRYPSMSNFCFAPTLIRTSILCETNIIVTATKIMKAQTEFLLYQIMDVAHGQQGLRIWRLRSTSSIVILLFRKSKGESRQTTLAQEPPADSPHPICAPWQLPLFIYFVLTATVAGPCITCVFPSTGAPLSSTSSGSRYNPNPGSPHISWNALGTSVCEH